MRNLLKYPKRFFMTFIGISGCIALIVSGLNLRSSISNIIPLQYEQLFDVNVEVVLRDSLTRIETEEEKERITNLEEVKESMLAYLKYAYINDTNHRLYLVIPEDEGILNDFVSLRNNEETYELAEEGGIITRKIASILNIKENDSVSIKDTDNNVFSIKINRIVDNYVDNYLYISKKYYNNLTKTSVKYNTILVRTNDDDYDEIELSNKINEKNTVSYLIHTSTAREMYNNIMKSLNTIVYVLVISAVILAFIVLYNLNTLNVLERKREIATIRVLGFFKKESYHYIENEIKLLAFISILFGIVFGYFFSIVLIKSCELDALMYDYSIVYSNYGIAIFITVVFLIITSLMSRKKMDSIQMVESLKKNE